MECKSCGAIINEDVCEYCGTSAAGEKAPPAAQTAANAAPARNPVQTIVGFFILFLMVFGIVFFVGKIAGCGEKNQADASGQKTAFDIYVEENNITLKGKDVMYDAKNTLDKPFVIEGKGKLSTYFNWEWRGADDTHFCVQVWPAKGSDVWYVYCPRDSFAELFEDLKDGETQMRLVCKIPKLRYNENQSGNNMAEIVYASWK